MCQETRALPRPSSDRNSFDHRGRLVCSWRAFGLYLTYYLQGSFSFEWVEKTEDLRMSIKDISSKKMAFSMSLGLLNAINKYERVTVLENGLQIADVIKAAAHRFSKRLSVKLDPRFDALLLKSHYFNSEQNNNNST
ncbi:predicted protein [Histoplasma capsulatum H143]|uniref:Uncharacterized protein n=1 Tax=Ajellomyces capsulatus (strain H143) TaxID=544712 RepID=C6HHP6_AJECH|nr:predicted protein [Histoplasma capsulatum H143]